MFSPLVNYRKATLQERTKLCKYAIYLYSQKNKKNKKKFQTRITIFGD